MNEQAIKTVLTNPPNGETPPKPNRFVTFLRRGINRKQAYEGQSMIEFALAIPFLLILLLVLVEVGFLLRTHTTMTSAVREMARVAGAAGSNDPLRWDASLNKYVPTFADGNTTAVGVLNVTLGSAELSRVITGGAELFRAKNWQSSDPNDWTKDDWASTPGGTARGWLPNQDKNWEPVKNPTRIASTKDTYYRQVFGKVAGSNVFTAATAFDLNQNYLNTTPCTVALCGSFANKADPTTDLYRPLPKDTDAVKNQKFLLNPWYPAFRRNCDVPGGNASAREDTRQSSTAAVNNLYYNSASAPEWIGAKLTYDYNFEFIPRAFSAFLSSNVSGIRLSDTAIKMFEPANIGNAELVDLNCDVARLRYLDYTPSRP
jgi:TadE-like protein